MTRRLLWNDIKHHKLLSISTVLFMAVSSLLISLAAVLLTGLLGSVDGLMEKAVTPDYLQMHAGEVQLEKIEKFAAAQEDVQEWQVSPFLNLDNSSVVLGNRSMADSTQDNGLCVQNDTFDYLLDMNDARPLVKEGEVYVPICYRSVYDLQTGDTMRIGAEELTVAGFIRDSQMSSMMASSKRFLVSEADYAKMKAVGEEEYLIEFLLKDHADTDTFATEYGNAGLYTNGPAITKPLIRMMNALSDGIMILVILLVGIGMLLISLLCIRFITALGVEKDKRETGMLKALGVANKDIRFLYFSKYILLSVVGAVVGLAGAGILIRPLSTQLREIYGASTNGVLSAVIAILVCAVVQGVILLFIRNVLKKLEKMTTLEALFSVKTEGKRTELGQQVLIGLVVAACVSLALIPQNLSSTISAPEFVTYMGIGDAEIRMDVRQSDNIVGVTEELSEKLSRDPEVSKYAVLKTISCPAYPTAEEQVNLLVETGDHSVFPVQYAEGRLPEAEGEIALSSLLAQDLGLQLGDTLELGALTEKGQSPEEDVQEAGAGGDRSPYVVCGIYSDITNGGKTAKVKDLPTAHHGEDSENAEGNVIWSVVYVSLKEGVQTAQWMNTYKQNGVDVVNIADYVQGTYGPTIDQIGLAKKIALGIAILIVLVVVLLFLRLLVERKRYSISLRKALGFTDTDIRKTYFCGGTVTILAGLLIGLLFGNILGESICGLILQSFGAFGFRFVIQPAPVIGIMVILLITAATAVYLGTSEITKIKAYECCICKE